MVPIATFLKFNFDDELQLSGKNIYSSTSKLVNFRSFDAYFSGPYQVSVSLKVNSLFKKRITYHTLLNDIFNNFPLINKYFDSRDTIPSYYNYVYYWNNKIYDKICPLIGQSYIYFSIFLCPILPLIFILLSFVFDNKISSETNEIKKYMYSYISIFFALCLCLNMTIMFQSIWLEILPLFLVYLTNIRLEKKF